MKLGFIGTGNMGNPIAANLIKAGHQLTINDLRREAATNLLEMGATWADSPKESAQGNEVVFTCLPGPREVEAVSLGEQGVLEGASPPSTYVDLSTNSPTVIRRIHQRFQEQGITVLDAPVSGGVYGAAAATLSVMVGGDVAAYRQIKPAFDANRLQRILLWPNWQRHGMQDLQQPAEHGHRQPAGRVADPRGQSGR